MHAVAKRNFDRYAARDLRVFAVQRERRFRHHDLVARIDERREEQRDELVAAVAEDDVFERETVRPRQAVAQFRLIVFRVHAERIDRVQRFERARRRAERVLVLRELYGVLDAEAAPHLIDGRAGLIRRERPECGAQQAIGRSGFHRRRVSL